MAPAPSSTLRAHWPEALIEAASLGVFMIAAIGFTILLEHPDSPVRAALPNDFTRRCVMGCAMGATLIGLVYNGYGARSGAHLNPVFTLTFWRLGKLDTTLAVVYATAQFVGGALGVALISAPFSALASDVHVHHAATTPGAAGIGAAFLGELAISFVQMSIVLHVSNSQRLHRFTGCFAALGVALYIVFEAPLSGMSMNPARTLASALGEGRFPALWLYFTAPLLGMLLAAELYVRRSSLARVFCAKLNHTGQAPCPFRCNYAALAALGSTTAR